MSLAGSLFGFAEDAQYTLKSPETDITSDTLSNDEASDGDDLCLESRFPSISKSECARFRKHYENDDECVKRLEELVLFRSMYEIDSPEFNQAVERNDDAADWEWAFQTAIQAAKTNPVLIPGLEGCASFEERFCNLDTMAQSGYIYKNEEDGSPALTKDGKPFVQYMSAILDLDETTGASPEVYATAYALYLERKSRSVNFDGIVLLIDTRQGTGWPNHNVLKVVPGIRLMASTIDKLHPGRKATMVVYPVPYACVYIFSMLKSWMPAAIAESELLNPLFLSNEAIRSCCDATNIFVYQNVLLRCGTAEWHRWG